MMRNAKIRLTPLFVFFRLMFNLKFFLKIVFLIFKQIL
ncbi:putative membrane protein [Helicobacter pylori Hp H-6]|uniref:Putative membrane protein n=1 Tax=Helicobacter pylori Hp H-6 TaxID=992061 RepID=J0MZK4_HELPX|nr:putative membrane protein [Helicobacter pylori Hp H-6]